jgi:transposase-like protein
MAFRHHEMSALVRHQPREARRRIVEAYERTGCRLALAAERLGVTSRTLDRWIDQLDLATALRKRRDEVRKSRQAA